MVEMDQDAHHFTLVHPLTNRKRDARRVTPLRHLE